MSDTTTFWVPAVGDVTLPMALGADQDTLDFKNIKATGTTELDGAVTGAGFVNAVKAVAAAQVLVQKAVILAPLPSDLTTMVNAVTPSDVALTIAAQPPQARKLQINIHIGTTTTTAITAGNAAFVGIDQDGNAISENISLIANTTVIRKTVNCYAELTSVTISAYAANGSGTGNTVGIGPSNDFGVSTGQGTVSNFAIVKATKVITTVTGGVTAWSRAVTDDVASTATVDPVARSIAPTTAPGVAGINDYEFTYSYTLAA